MAVVLALCIVAAYLIYRIKVGLHYKWNWGAIPQYLFRYDDEAMRLVPNLLMQGLFMTIRLSIWGTVIAAIIGLIMGLFRVSQSLFKRLVGRTYVELIRNLPPIVLIFIFYYFISDQIFFLFDADAFMSARSDCFQNIFGFFFNKIFIGEHRGFVIKSPTDDGKAIVIGVFGMSFILDFSRTPTKD